MQPAPFIAWVDYSAAEREHMRRALALFKENETRDELGLGAIRDALSDLLFPGTSTLHTRLRYMLFVPWIYQDLERRSSLTAGDLEQAVRKKELDLIKPLADTEAEGVFGKVAGHTISRLPSSVYWNGIRTWGLFRFDMSQDQFHRAWDELRERRRHVVRPDDTGIAPEDFSAWDHTMPEPPSPDWLKTASFELTPEEAHYLRDRMHLGRCEGSLLAHFATSAKADVEADFPWAPASQLPPRLDELVRQAEAFSLVMHGAAWLYNLALSRKSNHERHREGIKAYEGEMAKWAESVTTWISRWQAAELWRLLEDRGRAIPALRGDRRFVEAWTQLVKQVGADEIADYEPARRLIEQRELELKRVGRSRFANAGALARWSGASGTGRLNFRWHRVRGLLRDLYAGLDQA